MKNFDARTVWSLLMLIWIATTGIGILVWLSGQSGTDGLNPPQATLHEIADWMVKASVGALLGFAGGRAVMRNGRDDSG